MPGVRRAPRWHNLVTDLIPRNIGSYTSLRIPLATEDVKYTVTLSRSKVRRIACLIGLSTLLATATTVASAWLCAFVVRYDGTVGSRLSDDRPFRGYCLVMFSALGSEYAVRVTKYHGTVLRIPLAEPDSSQFKWSSLVQDKPMRTDIWGEEARGWPALCLRWQYTKDDGLQFGWDTGGHRKLVTVRADPATDPFGRRGVGSFTILEYGHTVLPLRPIWSGVVINVVVYGSCWMILLVGTLVVLRATLGLARRRRGLCPACGYNLRRDFASGCPECGWEREATS